MVDLEKGITDFEQETDDLGLNLEFADDELFGDKNTTVNVLC